MAMTALNKPLSSKTLGFWMCTALVVGNMIGSGIFLLPAALAPFGWNAIFAWLLTLTGGLCLACVFAALARAFPKAGGPYAYTREAFGDAPAFMVAWSYWVSMWVGNAAIATGTVSYLSVFFPAIANTGGLHALVACAMIWLLTLINCRGVIFAGGIQLVTTVLKILPLFAVVVIACFVVIADGGTSIAPFTPEKISIGPITAAATLTLWGLLGLESATVPAEKVKDPATTIPRATLFGMIITGLIYLFACSAVILLLPMEQAASSNAPFADFVSQYMGSGAAMLIAAFAAISGFGALNGWILLQGELPYAMAKGGVFPRWLGASSDRGTPVRAHLVASGLLTIVVMLNYSKSMTELFTFVVLLSTTASLFMFLMSSLAAIKLQREEKLKASSWLLLISLLAVLFAIWTIYGAGGDAVFWGVVLLVVGIPIYFVVQRQNLLRAETEK